MVFDVEDNKIVGKSLIELEKDNVLHEHFHGNPAPDYVHPVLTVDVIITGSMGAGFAAKMKNKGIEAVMTDERELEAVISKYLDGTLVRLQPETHHHHH